MKKYLAMAALAWAGLAHAGEYHRMGQLRCTDCHTMHASRQHSFGVDGTGTTFGGSTAPGTQTPNDRLLIQAGVNATCLACHDGQTFAPDVLGANGGLVAGPTRSAGHLNELAGTGATAANNYGHTLETTSAPPGFAGASWAGMLECDSCHAVHGSRAYRNLGMGRYIASSNFVGSYPFSSVGPTYTFVAAAGAVDPTVDVSINAGQAGGPLSYLSGTIPAASNSSGQLYQTANIQFGKGSGNATNAAFTGSGYPGVTTPLTLAPNGMNNYCAVCHGNFHGDTNTLGSVVGTTQHYIRHPTSNVTRTDATFTGAFTGVKDTDPMVALNSAQGDLVRAVFTDAAKGTFEVGCLTCHKAHGNDRPFGLIFPSHIGTVTDYENGDATLLSDGNTYPIRNLCITCHGMGRTY